MTKISPQTVNGKAFEYALLSELFSKLHRETEISIVQNEPYLIAKKCFNALEGQKQSRYLLHASFAVNFLLDIEPCLSHRFADKDILEIEIVADKAEQAGDVRDVLAVRALQKWEIGISAKNNHRAVKHSRLSADIDFGKKWLGCPCSGTYFSAIAPVFGSLAAITAQSKAVQKWDALGDYHKTVYAPILEAFRTELLRLDTLYPNVVASRLVHYLIGYQDFHKIIKGKNQVEIQAYNLKGTLNVSANRIKPKAKIPQLKLPNRLIDIVFEENSLNTLLVTLNEGWQVSFRTCLRSFSEIQISVQKPHKAGLVTRHSFEIPD